MNARLSRAEGAERPRIVSLLSSATEIVYALGLGPYLVGRSHECDYPPGIENLPLCTQPRIDCCGSSAEIDRLVKASVSQAISIYEVFDDVLERLQPTHILTQTQCEVCAVSLRDVERSVACRLASQPQIIALQPNCLADIWGDMRRVASSLNTDPEPTVAELQGRMQELQRRAALSGKRPRVACLEWLDPLMAAGNWVPELVEMAHGENLFGVAGKHSPWMDWAELYEAQPDVIFAMPCGFGLERTESETGLIAGRLEAVSRKVVIADGNQFFNRPGPRIVESLEILVEALHGGSGRLEDVGYKTWRRAGAPLN